MEMTFGEKIKECRKAQNLTQKQLADAIGAKHNSVSDWENNKNKPDPDTIELLCDALNITPNYLLKSSQEDFSTKEKQLIKKYRNLYQSDIEVSGGTIIGDLREAGKSGESGMGIRIQYAQNVYIHDVNIKECRGDGIYIGGNGSGSTNIRIIDCTIADCSRNCLGIL